MRMGSFKEDQLDHHRPRFSSSSLAALGAAAAFLATTIIVMAGEVKRTPMSTTTNSPTFCGDYAKRTIIQVKESKRLKCRFDGPRWDRNSDVHFRWCLRLKSPKLPNSETAARALNLTTCEQAIRRPDVSPRDVTAPSVVTKSPASPADVIAPKDPSDFGIKEKPSGGVLKKPLSQPH